MWLTFSKLFIRYWYNIAVDMYIHLSIRIEPTFYVQIYLPLKILLIMKIIMTSRMIGIWKHTSDLLADNQHHRIINQ